MEYGLIGEKLGHSYSKIIQERLLENYTYELHPLKKSELASFMKKREFKAINVTIPYKQEVIAYLDEMDDASKKIGAVNTVVNRDGKLYGYNTDYYGFAYTLSQNHIDVANKKVLVIGNGGAAKAIIAVLRDQHVSEIIICARTIVDNVTSLSEVYQNHSDVDIIVNTSPVGMYPHNEQTPISLAPFTKCSAVVDIIYNPLHTRLLVEAKAQNKQNAGGLSMLVAQAKYALEHFKQITIAEKHIAQIYEQLCIETQNIVLIGMPGCGKSSVAKELAKMSGKTLVDIDEEITKTIQMSISDYFQQYGEAKFREIEKQITLQVSKQTNLVISCGGGIVKDRDNINALQQNGVIVLLERALDELTCGKGRPLSKSKEEILQLYEERKHLYEEAYDLKVKNNKSVQEVARLVNEAFHSLLIEKGEH